MLASSSMSHSSAAIASAECVCHLTGVVWASRLGHTYHRPPPTIIDPLPDPMPRDRSPYPLVIPLDEDWEDAEILERRPPEPEEPDPPPEPDLPADIPPY